MSIEKVGAEENASSGLLGFCPFKGVGEFRIQLVTKYLSKQEWISP
ncbi:hypothetical protein P872_20685 [Rhodonellum psychrophilum GCM71 = DSM 17998]|uniref:Uncharacterized protein n=1 Tax=Rhodonellum psychrophilum GCM71 = DSM 17998 TaxID=1123057 RepID=U5BKZ1_9BACT|nr:hypothetical protein P872_20685 [Rhodonellum psychrophilum GCM71 = DSM 17998]